MDSNKEDKKLSCLIDFQREIDEIVSHGSRIEKVRANIDFIIFMMNSEDGILVHSPQGQGGKDWPLGAVVDLGARYGGHVFVDNRLEYGELEIDYSDAEEKP